MDARRMRALFALLLAALIIFGVGAFGSAQSEASVLLTLSVMDVGQGDSILISTSDGHAMLVDGGPADASGRVFEAIRKAGIDKLDVLISTHPHADHIGGLACVLDGMPVGKVIDSGKVHTSKTYEGYLEKILTKDIPFALGRAGSSFVLGPATVKILWPSEPLADNLNDCSVVVRVIYGKFSALLAGDIEAGSEQTLVRRKLLSPAVVLKVAYHGSDTSTTSAFLSVLRPAIAIIYAGAGNSYGHPTANVLARLKASGAKVYHTDTDGTVSVRSDGATWQVETERTDEKKAAVPAPLPEPASGAGQKYYGSKNSDVFHYPWCKHVASIKPANLGVFASRQEAIDKGYRPCKVCKP
ncbi:MAG TPA: MBL fold metallo-hydrolase [Methanomassiliicoccaceae archaeon]|nr:MBL fold metallo-hydrolase [Methanomassiliicoccaceae archaeon]